MLFSRCNDISGQKMSYSPAAADRIAVCKLSITRYNHDSEYDDKFPV